MSNKGNIYMFSLKAKHNERIDHNEHNERIQQLMRNEWNIYVLLKSKT